MEEKYNFRALNEYEMIIYNSLIDAALKDGCTKYRYTKRDTHMFKINDNCDCQMYLDRLELKFHNLGKPNGKIIIYYSNDGSPSDVKASGCTVHNEVDAYTLLNVLDIRLLLNQ